MCSPVSLPLPLSALGLDALAVLARHPGATADVTAAFHAALLGWTQERLRAVATWLQPADADDLAHDFWLRCVTRYLPAWDPTTCAVSGFLYRRLRCDAIDRLRQQQRKGAGAVNVDDVEVEAPATDAFAVDAAREREARLARLDAAVDRLPRRRRAVLRRSLQGEALGSIAKDVRIHVSTASRERHLAIAAVKTALAA